MNKLLILFGCLIVSNVLFGQYTSEGESTSRFRGGIMWFNTGLRPVKIDKIRKYDRLIFDVTYNDWVGNQKLFRNKWSSSRMSSLRFPFMPPVSITTVCGSEQENCSAKSIKAKLTPINNVFLFCFAL